jgi:hypothetical protein
MKVGKLGYIVERKPILKTWANLEKETTNPMETIKEKPYSTP